jgi:hypothetical protein
MSAANALRVCRVVTCVERVEATSSAAGVGQAKVWSAAVVAHPWVGQRRVDLAPFSALGEKLGEQLGRHALTALGCEPHEVTSYGKGAIVGEGGELELAAALLHPQMGRPLRAMIGRGKAIIPSTIKHGGAGTRLDVPLHGADDEWDFSLLDAVEVFVRGAPLADEIVVAVALGTGGRAHARIRKKDPER